MPLPSSSSPLPSPGAIPRRARAVLLALLCVFPLGLSLPSLGDPFGQTEEAVNATIWGLGARNVLEEGPVAAWLGAKVAPFPGPGGRGDIYAHHPPLPVWLAALIQLVSEREAAPRLVALGLAALSLLLLFSVVRVVAGEGPALVATAVIATCPYVLGFGRLFTTLTLATPLYLFALRVALRRHLEGKPWGWSLPAALAGLVLSSWDGVLGAAAIGSYLAWVELRAGQETRGAGRWMRALAPLLAAGIALAAVVAYLVWANGGAQAMLWQFRYRASTNLDPWAWCSRQLGFLSGGLGWVTLLLLAAAPALAALEERPRRLALAAALSAIPGLGMLLIFRQGADRHPFWAYNLILPAAFVVAGVLRAAVRARRPWLGAALLCALGVQAVVGFRRAGEQLSRERLLNGHGALIREYFGAHPAPVVRIFSKYNFYPFVSWYLRVPPEVVSSAATMRERLRTGSWQAGEVLVVDMEWARRVGCAPFTALAESTSRRWVIAPAGAVAAACSGGAG